MHADLGGSPVEPVRFNIRNNELQIGLHVLPGCEWNDVLSLNLWAGKPIVQSLPPQFTPPHKTLVKVYIHK